MELRRAALVGLSIVALMVLASCGTKKTVLGPVTSSGDDVEFRTVQVSPDVTVRVSRSIPDSINFSVGVDDSTGRAGPLQALASWYDGTRIRYGWDYDRDFYIDYKTPRSCCYRVYMTYALYYALQLAGKPLVVYGLSCNADGTITWRIVIGASVLRYISPASDWFLMWQAKMQYLT